MINGKAIDNHEEQLATMRRKKKTISEVTEKLLN